MSLEEAFKLVIATLLGVISFIGSKIFSATMENTTAINKLSIEMEHMRKVTERIAKLEGDIIKINQARPNNGHFKGNGK